MTGSSYRVRPPAKTCWYASTRRVAHRVATVQVNAGAEVFSCAFRQPHQYPTFAYEDPDAVEALRIEST